MNLVTTDQEKHFQEKKFQDKKFTEKKCQDSLSYISSGHMKMCGGCKGCDDQFEGLEKLSMEYILNINHLEIKFLIFTWSIPGQSGHKLQ